MIAPALSDVSHILRTIQYQPGWSEDTTIEQCRDLLQQTLPNCLVEESQFVTESDKVDLFCINERMEFEQGIGVIVKLAARPKMMREQIARWEKSQMLGGLIILTAAPFKLPSTRLHLHLIQVY